MDRRCAAGPFVIAIDGPAASGKGTIARRIAAALNLDHLDTGALYRAVGAAVLEAGGDPADEETAVAAARAIDAARLDPATLRTDAIGEAASKVAAIPAVRAALLAYQKSFAAAPPGGRGAVIDGRDIATVIAPEAPVKIFVTADPAIRAHRRYLELKDSRLGLTEAAVLADLEARDRRDSGRSVAPLRQAADARLLDTSRLDIDAAVAAALAIVEAVLD
ncbi:MAG: (d)CMP kinase [Alphaproteobacteria bacterium]|nr:(d)CMP kinase [Alphaproteobacteria bacterium]